jgi:hypothetical protein
MTKTPGALRTETQSVESDAAVASVITMTLPLLADVDPSETAANLTRELASLVSLVQGTDHASD